MFISLDAKRRSLIRMLSANHQTEHRDSNGGAREKNKAVEGVCNPIGRTTISTKQMLQSSQELNY